DEQGVDRNRVAAAQTVDDQMFGRGEVEDRPDASQVASAQGGWLIGNRICRCGAVVDQGIAGGRIVPIHVEGGHANQCSRVHVEGVIACQTVEGDRRV